MLLECTSAEHIFQFEKSNILITKKAETIKGERKKMEFQNEILITSQLFGLD